MIEIPVETEQIQVEDGISDTSPDDLQFQTVGVSHVEDFDNSGSTDQAPSITQTIHEDLTSHYGNK